MLEEAGPRGHFRRLGYVQFGPGDTRWSGISADQVIDLRLFARDVVREHFMNSQIPDSVCDTADHTGRYSITLV